jgi:hypothetical protein
LIIDPDLLDDYPPERSINYSFPAQLTIIFAKVAIQTALFIVFNANLYQNIPRSAMPNYLQSAKIVLDLALPGPERLAGEGLLLGSIPIVSNRWNGASAVDFPAITKVSDCVGITGSVPL